MSYAIEMQQITKKYGELVANDAIQLSVVEGHIHAVLGENGAGKSTLMKILFGEERPTEGSIKVYGQPVVIDSPAKALDLSISLIHQNFTLVNEFTIAQNFALGIEETRAGVFSDYAPVNRKIEEILKRLDMRLDIHAPVGTFSVEEQQIIEIGKALYRGARILVLDEPTSVLTPQRIEKLLEILKVLRQEGKTIILITHKLEEALSIADEISVLRKGKLVATLPREQVTREELITMMVGSEPLIAIEKKDCKAGTPMVEIDQLSVVANRTRAVRNVCFNVHRGEIFGLTGVGGNGQAELVEALIGLRPPSEGEIRFQGKKINGWNIHKRRLNGFAYVPENRLVRGSAGALSVYDNLIMGHHYQPGFHQGLLLMQNRLQDYAQATIERYGVVASSMEIEAGSLSGGNLQKLIIGREFSFDASFLIVAYPSQGIDIRTTKYVHAELIRRRDEGCAILLVSGDLDEIFSLSDRIGVMFSGELVAITRPENTNRFELGQFMLGARRQG